MKTLILYVTGIFALFFSQMTHAQRTLKAVHTDIPPKIDARKDAVWDKAEETTGFYMFDPGNGNPEPKEYSSSVRVLYDDDALYFYAELHDPDPGSIFREFSLRDQFSKSDVFLIYINPFLASGNTFFFGVNASGSQLDGIQAEDMDFSWNAEWFSAVDITGEGWTVEMSIPYSCLRFHNENSAEWGLSFARAITSRNEKYAWQRIDKTKGGDVVQFLGRLTGLNKISPPIRLNLYPYASLSYNKDPEFSGQWKHSFGLDVKYGINEQFTLDAGLIPDYSDTSVDNVKLNLSPFEQFYEERRPFFLEGMQLFKKGRIFYSRRIGGKPSLYHSISLNENEEVYDNPDRIPLLNTLKVSGRWSNGLGMGVLNAVGRPVYAVVRDTLTGAERQVMTEPWSNYNVSVLDYSFKKNNSISLINTNLLRADGFRNANVTSFTYDLNFQKNTLKIKGNSAMSNVFENGTKTSGYKNACSITKKIGGHEASVEFFLLDTDYNQRDMGYMRKNNLLIYDFEYSYNSLKPTGIFHSYRYGIDLGLDHIYKPYGTFRRDVDVYWRATLKNQWGGGMYLGWVSDVIDYYEPHVDGRYYIRPYKWNAGMSVSGDNRKKINFDTGLRGAYTPRSNEVRKKVFLHLKASLSDRLKVIYNIEVGHYANSKGFYATDEDMSAGEIVYFGERDIFEMPQMLSLNYYFTVKSALKIETIHNWSQVKYKRRFTLDENGALTNEQPLDDGDNFNYWNLDFGYIWEYAPGSKLTLLYRNSLFNTDLNFQASYMENMDHLFRQSSGHTFLIKTIYNLDYSRTLKKWF